MPEEDFDDELEERGPSKSQRKRNMQLLRDLGEKLLSLPVDHLEKISEPAIVTAVQDCKKITKGNARKRQIQFIGKLLAKSDISDISITEEILSFFGRKINVMICDLSPQVSGNWSVDHSTQISLNYAAAKIMDQVLEKRETHCSKFLTVNIQTNFMIM